MPCSTTTLSVMRRCRSGASSFSLFSSRNSHIITLFVVLCIVVDVIHRTIENALRLAVHKAGVGHASVGGHVTADNALGLGRDDQRCRRDGDGLRAGQRRGRCVVAADLHSVADVGLAHVLLCFEPLDLGMEYASFVSKMRTEIYQIPPVDKYIVIQGDRICNRKLGKIREYFCGILPIAAADSFFRYEYKSNPSRSSSKDGYEIII